VSDTTRDATGEVAPAFELPNVGPGEDPFTPMAAAAEYDSLVILFQRDYYCGNCREQVADVRDRFDEFEAVGALPVSVLPESVERTRDWQEVVELPYPVLADPNSAVGDEYDQPNRFGILGNAFDLVGRMPLAVVLDLTGAEPTVYESYPGRTPGDRPDIDDLLDDCRACRETDD
jgi:peroxiredoxin Q/BCP